MADADVSRVPHVCSPNRKHTIPRSGMMFVIMFMFPMRDPHRMLVSRGVPSPAQRASHRMRLARVQTSCKAESCRKGHTLTCGARPVPRGTHACARHAHTHVVYIAYITEARSRRPHMQPRMHLRLVSRDARASASLPLSQRVHVTHAPAQHTRPPPAAQAKCQVISYHVIKVWFKSSDHVVTGYWLVRKCEYAHLRHPPTQPRSALAS